MSKIYVTHFYRRPPLAQGWISTGFITQKEGDPSYYFGLTGKKYSEENIEIDEYNGSIKAVYRTPINEDEAVYIAPDQSVYIGKIFKPRSNSPRLIGRDKVALTPTLIDATLAVDEILRSGHPYERRRELESFVTYDYWQAVTQTIIEAAKKGILQQEQLASIGYIFYKVQNMFGQRALQFIDSKDASITDGTIEYFDKRGRKQSVAIIMDSSIPKNQYNDDDPTEREFELAEDEFLKR